MVEHLLTNPRSERVRAVAGLARQSARERTGLFLAEGPQPVREALRHRRSWVGDVYVTRAARDRHTDIAAEASGPGAGRLRMHLVTDEVMRAMSATQAPQGVLAVCRVPGLGLPQALAGQPQVVCLLSEVRDPGNAGTVLRGADAAGSNLVVVSSDSVDVWSPKVVRSSAGSLFHVPVVTGVPTTLAVDALRAAGLTVLAADSHATRLLGDMTLDRPHAWVFGNEARGLSREVLDRCDERVRVPIYGSAESLNLAMAATLCLYASAAGRRCRPS